MQVRPLFTATDAALNRITELFDFLWPAAVGLWNLRWQVSGLDQQLSVASESILQARLVQGSKIHGANLRRACLETTWEEQQQQLAHVLLTNLFAIHEGWCSELVEEITGKPCRDLSEGLQFPSSSVRKGKMNFPRTLKDLTATPSSSMKTYQPAFLGEPLVSPNHIDDLLTVYRYFKEYRNSIMHNGGRASQSLVKAALAASIVAKKPGLPFKIPLCAAVTLNDPVQDTLHSVVGFSDLVRRLVLTTDALNSGSNYAEKKLVDRWRKQFGVLTLKANAAARLDRLGRHLRTLRLPPTPDIATLEGLLRRVGLIH